MELDWMREKQTESARQFRFLWVSVIIVLLDQFVKIAIKATLPLYHSKHILGEYLMLTHVQNTGAAFSISLGTPQFNRYFFIIMMVFAIGFVIYLMYKSTNNLQRISLSLIIGGAIGNLIDRVLFGYVTDFLDADFPDIIMQRWPVFNIADSSIVIAMGLLILDMLIHKQPEKTVIKQETPVEMFKEN
jgi:signal peptidase II